MNKIFPNILLVIALIASGFVFFGVTHTPVSAQRTDFGSLTPCSPEDCPPGLDPNSIALVNTAGSEGSQAEGAFLVQFVNRIYQFAIIIASVSAVIMIIIGGVKYITSRDNPSKKSDAKQTILNALIGLLIVLAAWALLNTINPQLLNFNFSFGK